MKIDLPEGGKPPPRIHGAITALVTPFKNGALDHVGLMGLVEWQIRNGIAGLVACGTTGEAPTLTEAEQTRIIGICVEIAEGKLPIIAGTGTNSTETTIARTRRAYALGANAALVVVPYYSKPTQEGICRHFEAVAASSDIPLIIYNVPSRTAADLSPATIERLAKIPTVIGIKDATGDISRIVGLSPLLRHRLTMLSGHDATALAFAMVGGRGTISVASNVVPRLFSAMQQAAQAGNFDAALALQHRLRPLMRALELETNPVPVKYALHLMRGLDPEVRLPLVPAEEATKAAIRAAVEPFLKDPMSGCKARSLVRFDI